MANKMAEALSGAGSREEYLKLSRRSGDKPTIEEHYFVEVNGSQRGPFSFAELENNVRAGELVRESLIWSKQLVDWTPAGQVAALDDVFADVPPPLPKQQ
jgi:hypothetical protein